MRFKFFIAILVGLVLWGGGGVGEAAQEALFVKSGRHYGISGIAVVDTGKYNTFLVVHDSPQNKQGGLSLLQVKGNQVSLRNINTPLDFYLPQDFEAISSLYRDQRQTFMVLSSFGKVYHVRFDLKREQISVIKAFNLPNHYRGNFEGFDIFSVAGRYLAVWADRGNTSYPARLYWAWLDLDTYQFSRVRSVSVTVPWPRKRSVRHIAEVRVDPSGEVFIVAASDGGNDGPFSAALYRIGVFVERGKDVALNRFRLGRPICMFENNKVEGFDFYSFGDNDFVCGSDDENKGSALFFVRENVLP